MLIKLKFSVIPTNGHIAIEPHWLRSFSRANTYSLSRERGATGRQSSRPYRSNYIQARARERGFGIEINWTIRWFTTRGCHKSPPPPPLNLPQCAYVQRASVYMYIYVRIDAHAHSHRRGNACIRTCVCIYVYMFTSHCKIFRELSS